jgi:hypothetical protein
MAAPYIRGEDGSVYVSSPSQNPPLLNPNVMQTSGGSLVMSFPDPLAASDGPWEEFFRRAACTRETTPSRPCSRQSEISDISDLTMASELLRSEPASQWQSQWLPQSQTRYDAYGMNPVDPIDASDRVDEHDSNIHIRSSWSEQLFMLLLALIRVMCEVWITSTEAIYKGFFQTRVKAITAANRVGGAPAPLLQATMRSLSTWRISSALAAASAILVSLFRGASRIVAGIATIAIGGRQTRSKRGRLFTLACSAISLILLFNQAKNGYEFLRDARNSFCVISSIPQICPTAHSRADRSEVNYFDASKDPQTIVFQQSSELEHVLQSSMSNNDLRVSLSASSKALRTLARQIEEARLPSSAALVEDMLRYGNDVVRALFRIGDFDQSIRDGTSR